MLALRLLLMLCGAVIVFTLLGYSLNRDPRWLRFAVLIIKGGLALAALLLIVAFVSRFLLL
jgi:hypothetical protein